MHKSVVLIRFNNKAYNIHLWDVEAYMQKQITQENILLDSVFFFFVKYNHSHTGRSPVQTNIQNEMIEGGHGGVKMSGKRS